MTLHPLAVTDAERPFLDALVASGDPLGDMAKWMHELDRMGYSLNQARGAMGWLAGLANGMTSGGSGTRSAYRRMFAELQAALDAPPDADGPGPDAATRVSRRRTRHTPGLLNKLRRRDGLTAMAAPQSSGLSTRRLRAA